MLIPVLGARDHQGNKLALTTNVEGNEVDEASIPLKFLLGAVSIAMRAKGNDEIEIYRQTRTRGNAHIFRVCPLVLKCEVTVTKP